MLLALALAASVCAACASAAPSPPVHRSTEPGETGEAEVAPRRPDGVWLEPPPAIPAAQAASTGDGPVVALRTPIDRAQIVRLVHRFVEALVRNDERAIEALCAPSPAGGVQAATRMRVLTRSHDYTKLSGQRVFRDENVRVRRGNEDADGGTHDAGPDERDTVSVRVTIDVSQAGGEVLFGAILGLELVDVSGALLIKDLDLNADP